MAVDARNIIEQTWTRRGMDPRAGQVIAQLESNFDPNAQNPNSSAGGLFQFIDSTAADYGLTDKRNPWQNSDAGARFASDNASHLSKVLGRELTIGELYLAHQQGAGGAAKLLGNPNARAVDVVGADAVRLNGGDESMTAGEFANLWIDRAERAERELFGGPERIYQANDTAPITTDSNVINEVYQAYSAGLMSPEQAAEYEAAVQSGSMRIPEGAELRPSEGAPITDSPNVALEVYSAYVGGEMDGPTQAEYLEAVNSGRMPVPPGATIGPGMQELLPSTDDGPAPLRVERSISGELSSPFFEGASASIAGVTGSGESVAGQMLPESTPYRDALGRVLDVPLAGLQFLGGATAGAAGAAGDIAHGLGMSRGHAERLGRDLAAIPEAFAGNPAGLSRIATAPKISPRQMQRAAQVADADATIAAGAERGVRVMTTDVMPPQTFAGRWLQSGAEKIPLAGTGGTRAAQSAERADAIEDVVRMYAADGVTVDDILPLISDDLVKSNSAFRKRYSGMKNEVIDRLSDLGQVDVSRTISAIDNEIASLRGMNTQGVAPVIARLEDMKTSIQGQNLRGVEDLRKLFGESFKASDLANVRSVGEAALSRIYRPLREDMGDFIKANGQRRDFTQWGVANARLADNINEVQNTALRTAFKNADTKPETVRSLLFSRNRSDVQRIYSRLSQEGKGHARAAVLLEAAEKSTNQGLLSPTRFASNIDRMGRQVGVVFTGEDRRVMEGLGRVLRATQRADQAALNPPTGVQNMPFLAGIGLTEYLGASGAIAGAGGIGATARMIETPAMRNALLAISRARSGSSQEQALINRYSEMIKSGVIAGTVTGGDNE